MMLFTTIVVYMNILQTVEISKKLIEYRREKLTPIAIISQGTTVHQKVIIGCLNEFEND